MDDLNLFWFICLGLFLAGIIKGSLGIGFPVVAMSILTILLEPQLAVAMVALPVLVTNAWQAARGGGYKSTFIEFKWLIIPLVLGTSIGAIFVSQAKPAVLLALIGGVAVAFAIINFINPSFEISKEQQKVYGPVTGMGAGVIGGLTTVHGPPIIIYLMSIGLKKEEFVKKIGFIWFCGSIPMFGLYVFTGLIGLKEFLWSLFALLPVFIGVYIGENIRKRIDQEVFSKLIVVSLFFIGLNLIRKSIL